MEKDNQHTYNAVEQVATSLLERSIPIEKAAKVQKDVKELHNVDVSITKI